MPARAEASRSWSLSVDDEGAVVAPTPVRLGRPDRVRADDPGSPAEDREMLVVMRRGVRKLPAPQLARLQQIYEKSIRMATLRE